MIVGFLDYGPYEWALFTCTVKAHSIRSNGCCGFLVFAPSSFNLSIADVKALFLVTYVLDAQWLTVVRRNIEQEPQISMTAAPL